MCNSTNKDNQPTSHKCQVYNGYIDYNNIDFSKHMKNDRMDRLIFINNLCGVGHIVDKFLVDNNHKDGKEIHVILSNGCCHVFNYETLKFITVFILYPQQFIDYYKKTNKKYKKEILHKCIRHARAGYQEIQVLKN